MLYFLSCQRTPPQERVKRAHEKLALKTLMYDRKVARMQRKAAAKAAATMAKKTTAGPKGFLLCYCLSVPLWNRLD